MKNNMCGGVFVHDGVYKCVCRTIQNRMDVVGRSFSSTALRVYYGVYYARVFGAYLRVTARSYVSYCSRERVTNFHHTHVEKSENISASIWLVMIL